MRYYVSWKTTGYCRKDSLKLAARCPVSGCWPSCLYSVLILASDRPVVVILVVYHGY